MAGDKEASKQANKEECVITLANAVRGFDQEFADLTTQAMLQPRVFANYAYMGRTELFHHERPYSFEDHLGKNLCHRLSLLYTTDDFWAPEVFCQRAAEAGARTSLVTTYPGS